MRPGVSLALGPEDKAAPTEPGGTAGALPLRFLPAGWQEARRRMTAAIATVGIVEAMPPIRAISVPAQGRLVCGAGPAMPRQPPGVRRET